MTVNIFIVDKVGSVGFSNFLFPGGEPHVRIDHPVGLTNASVLIDARVGNMNDMGMLLAVTDAVHRCRPKSIELLIPYFPGARQDRVEPGTPLTVKIYADLVNLQRYDIVWILDPHSAVTSGLIDNCQILRHVPLVQCFIQSDITGLICPDAGAEKRTLDLAREIGCETVVFARKERDVKTGDLSGFSLDPLPRPGAYLVVDDICDGGGTFIGLAEQYRLDPNGTGPLDLWVTHGIFSKGIAALAAHYRVIGCSDSFPCDELHPRLNRVAIPELTNRRI